MLGSACVAIAVDEDALLDGMYNDEVATNPNWKVSINISEKVKLAQTIWLSDLPNVLVVGSEVIIIDEVALWEKLVDGIVALDCWVPRIPLEAERLWHVWTAWVEEPYYKKLKK